MSAHRPIKNAAYTFRDFFRTNNGALAATPTITGSQGSIDGAALAPLTAATEVPAGSAQLLQPFTAAQMGGDRIELQVACSAVARAIDGWVILTEPCYESGEVQTDAGNTTSAAKLRAGASATDNLYRFMEFEVVRGTNAGYRGIILAYNGTTKFVTLSPPMPAAADNTIVYKVNAIPQWQGLQAALNARGILVGTVTAATSGSVFTDSALAAKGTDQLVNSVIVFLTGANATGGLRAVSAYATSTGQFTTRTAFPNTPNVGDVFLVFGTVG